MHKNIIDDFYVQISFVSIFSVYRNPVNIERDFILGDIAVETDNYVLLSKCKSVVQTRQWRDFSLVFAPTVSSFQMSGAQPQVAQSQISYLCMR